MRKLIFILSSILVLLYSCGTQEKEVPVTSVTISPPSAEMVIGETLNLKASVSPANATTTEIVWASSKQSVATVSQTGMVMANSEGTSTITASAGGKVGSCQVTVIKGHIAVESIELDTQTLSLMVGDEYILSATVKPSDATDSSVSWESSDNSVATVVNGKVKAQHIGKARITARAGDKSTVCDVTVVEKTIPVSYVKLSHDAVSFFVGETKTLTATVYPDDATDKEITWSTSDPAVVTVNGGILSGVKEGSAEVTASAGGKQATCRVTVNYVPVQSVALDKTSLTLYAGETSTLDISYTPKHATYRTASWTSSDPSVAVVEDGKVTAVSRGKATITAEAEGKKASCSVEVLAALEGISLNKSELRLKVGGSETLTAAISPEGATLKENLVWRSSDASVASVSQEGKVVALKEGTTTINVSADGKMASCAVTVYFIHVSEIVLSQTEATLDINNTLQLKAEVYPVDATSGEVEWSSSDPSVATVSGSGLVSARGKGTATVYAKADGKEAACVVTVVITVVSVSLSTSGITMARGNSYRLIATVNPSDASYDAVEWTSSDVTVATVDGQGNVTAAGPGTSTITASVGDKYAQCAVTVVVPLESISLNRNDLALKKGESETLVAVLTPSDATGVELSWESSDDAVVTVDGGKVTAVGGGNAVVKVKAGSLSAQCDVTVTVPIESISLPESPVVAVGQSKQLEVKYKPMDATRAEAQWSSSDPKIVTVEKGLIKGVAEGKCTITVKVGTFTASCEVECVPVNADFGGFDDENNW